MSYYNPMYYGTNNQYGTAEPRFNQMQMQPQFQNTGMQQLPQSYLNGKFVESSDIVKVTDVPFSGYGIFPKTDLSEVYIKSWNPNGTTSIVTYKPVITKEPEEVNAEIINTLAQRVQELEDKFSRLGTSQPAVEKTDSAPRKEVQF